MYVGNLDLQTNDQDLLDAFLPFGAVSSASVMRNFLTGRGHGYGFVEMSSEQEAAAALRGLDGHSLRGRPLFVQQSHA